MVKDNSFGIANLQEKMLDLLKYIQQVCKKYDLTYYACGGTCLGAVRHGGFIPWDDDLDIYMPRPDYEKLWAMRDQVNVKGKFVLCRSTREKNYHHRVMQLTDVTTTFINRRSINEDIEHGVYIDIIPLDARAKGKINQLKQIKDAIFYSVYNIQNLPEFNGGNLERNAVSFLLNLIQNPDRRYRIWSKAEKRMTSIKWDSATEIIELTTSVGALRKPYPKQWFGIPVVLPFEDTTINVPHEYNLFLTQVYGDYMKLPPVQERHPRHNTVKIDLDNSYIIYRGKYYLKGK